VARRISRHNGARGARRSDVTHFGGNSRDSYQNRGRVSVTVPGSVTRFTRIIEPSYQQTVLSNSEMSLNAVARLGSGDCFGEVGIVEGRRRTASVHAAGDSDAEVLAIPRASLLRLTESAPAVHNDFVAVVMQRLHAAVGGAAQSD